MRGRRNYLPWADGPARVADPRALYRANSRFKKRMRWVKRQAYNDGRAALRAAGFSTDRLPPVLVCVLELQKRGALHAHLALGYTTDAERVFARAFIDSLKKWTPRCGLGFVDGWQYAERKSMYSSERAASYLCKYLTKIIRLGSCERSRGQVFREQARFREAFPGETTPQRLVDLLKAEEGATWFKRGVSASTRIALRGDAIIEALGSGVRDGEGEPL